MRKYQSMLSVNELNIDSFHWKIVLLKDYIGLNNTMLSFCHAKSHFWGLKARMFYRNSTWVLYEYDISVSSTHGSLKKTPVDNGWQ